MQDDLGDRMKMYEQAFLSQRLMPRLPALARLDGKCFSKFTKGLERPYDKRLVDLMIEITKVLIDETSGLMGYTQSDEITVLMYPQSLKSDIYFNGRIQKMVGDLASLATLKFNQLMPEFLPEKAHLSPRFDCRVWNVPTKEEAINAFLWRELDATKNSITTSSSCHYSHKELLNKNSSEKQEMLFQKGINWIDYPDFFKRGTYIRKEKIETMIDKEELDKLPPKHKARKNPDLKIKRSVIKKIEMPPLSKVKNKVEVFFEGAEPKL